VIESLIVEAAERLRPDGHLLMEISPTIHDSVRRLLEADARFDSGPTIKDLARLPRVVRARRLRHTVS
jgi:methylase of polypeptide subunit release factors